MIEVTLSWQEARYAAMAGCERRIEALRTGRQRREGLTNDSAFHEDVQSAAAELAFAKARGLYWVPVVDNPDDLPGDVGNVQIRQTARPNGCLIMHDKDSDDAPFVLVTGEIPTFTLAGWAWGRDCKDRDEYWRQDVPHPAYFVPQARLREVK